MKRTFLLTAGFILASAGAAAVQAQPRLRDLPGKHETDRTVVLRADVACSPDRAFAMWSTEAGVRSFFAPAARIGASPGGRYTIMFFPDEDPEGMVHGTAGAHVLASEPSRFYAFEWVVFAGDEAKGDNAPPYASPEQRLPDALPTWVEITLTPAGSGTHVEFRHFGFGEGELWGRSYTWFSRAWAGVLHQMEATCRTAPAG
jgi:uncharacterized protein YndB with AHSA1/START domain